MSLRWPSKDKDEKLDFSLDWSRVLSTGETLSSVSWKVKNASGTKETFDPVSTVNGLTVSGVTLTGTVATIYLEDGTNNKEYKLYCSVTTSEGRTMERPVKIRIREYE